MAKDDYHVIVFRILSYLYRQLKNGEAPDPDMLRADGKICNRIPESYWKFILENMQEEGLIRGLEINPDEADSHPPEEQLDRLQITIKGIEQLCDSRMGERVDQLIKGILNIG